MNIFLHLSIKIFAILVPHHLMNQKEQIDAEKSPRSLIPASQKEQDVKIFMDCRTYFYPKLHSFIRVSVDKLQFEKNF